MESIERRIEIMIIDTELKTLEYINHFHSPVIYILEN